MREKSRVAWPWQDVELFDLGHRLTEQSPGFVNYFSACLLDRRQLGGAQADVLAVSKTALFWLMSIGPYRLELQKGLGCQGLPKRSAHFGISYTGA